MAKKQKATARNRSSKSTNKNTNPKMHDVNWVLTLVMSIIFGWFGVDRFIMCKVWTGILKLITFGGLGIWWIVDIVLIATKYEFKNVRWK